MRTRFGFSLVELSIVLVILGLLTGGILSGQALIRAAELRSVTEDVKKYQTIAFAFRDKYMALPGDMANATRFWGEQHATPSTCQTTVSTSTLTCSGNGDGRVGNQVAEYYERYRFWQHLANAGLVEGSYTGVTGSGGAAHAVPGANVPAGKISNSGFTFRYLGALTGSSASFDDAAYGHVLDVGTGTTTGNTSGVLLRAEEAWNIDTKLDDGKPAYGRVMGYKNTHQPNCVTTDTAATAAYDLANTSIGCGLIIKTGV